MIRKTLFKYGGLLDDNQLMIKNGIDIKLIFRTGSFWIGVHKSEAAIGHFSTRVLCINLIPMLTLKIETWGK